MKNLRIIKIIIAGASIMIGAGISYFFFQHNEAVASEVVDYEPTRDRQFILHLFDIDWYWLLAQSRSEYSPEFVLDFRSRTRDPEDFGRLTIKVIIVQNQPAGFITYFIETPSMGRILHLDVDPEFRRRHLAEKLIRYACAQLFAQGVSKVRLITRTDNIPAQKLYIRTGFTETARDSRFIWYEKQK